MGNSMSAKVIAQLPANEEEAVVRELAQVLGFDTDQVEAEPVYAPYIAYIQSCWPGKGDKSDYLRLFTCIVKHFKVHPASSIQSFIDSLVLEDSHYYFRDSVADSPVRRIAAHDNVLLVLGLWTLMREYFIPTLQDRRHVLHICEALSSSSSSQPYQPLEASLSTLIKTSKLLPSRDEGPTHDEPVFPISQAESIDSESVALRDLPFARHSLAGLTESLSIEPRQLNLVKLIKFADVHILWTDNISRHMLLSKRGKTRYIELFALPCAFQEGARDVLRGISIRTDVLEEIETSYANLFNPSESPSWHVYLGMVFGIRLWCWCLGCSSGRLRKRAFGKLAPRSSLPTVNDRTGRMDGRTLPFDPLLSKLAQSEPLWWDQSMFENLWPRIVTLDRCLQEARPWSFWILLRDNRDTVQYWTFLFGTVILVLTILQVGLGAAQVASG